MPALRSTFPSGAGAPARRRPRGAAARWHVGPEDNRPAAWVELPRRGATGRSERLAGPGQLDGGRYLAPITSRA